MSEGNGRTPSMIIEKTPAAAADDVDHYVEIPRDALIQCPKEGGAIIRGQACEKCDYFEALNIRMQGKDLPFEARYTCLCKFPKQRAFFKAKID